MHPFQRLTIYVVLLAQALLPLGCSHDTTYHGPAQEGGLFGALATSFNLGEKAFVLVRSRLAVSAVRPAEKVAALEARHTDFVNAVNAVITREAVQTLGPTFRAIFALVDDGTLPRAAENAAQVLESIANEPNERTIRALVALSDGKTVMQVDDVLAYMARSANLPEFEDMIEAVAQIVEQNDGVDAQGNPNGEPKIMESLQAFIASGLRDYAAVPATTTATLFGGISSELLALAPRNRSGAALVGDPVWAVRVDTHGNPAVAKNAQGALLPPFVDRNLDGAADVNADGEPVDAQGGVISIPAFGIPGAPGRDADGRAYAPSSTALAYVYFDAKQTLLAHTLAMGGEGLRRRLHEQAYDTLVSALSARVSNDAGTPLDTTDDYMGLASDDALVDLAWGGLEVVKLDTSPRFVRAIAEVARTDPALAERLLVTAGKIVEKLRPIALRPSSVPAAQSNQLVDRMVLLGDRVFDQRQGTSVGRLLFDVVNGLGKTARRLPDQLALMARYKKLAVDQSGNLIVSSSIAVDRSAPASVAGQPGGENRSSLHQLLDLLAHADQCNTFVWVGRPLSETIIELMAGRTAGSASTLIGFLQNPIVRSAARLVCPGIDGDLDSLQALAASGALEGFLPIAKAFVDRGETRLLIDILKTLDADYTAVVRPYEGELADCLSSGAFEPIFDGLDLLVAGRAGAAVRDPVTGQRAVDAVADALSKLLDHPTGGVIARRGVNVPSRLHLLLEPMRRIDANLSAASGGQSLFTALVYSVTDLLCERTVNDAGTPADASDDFEELVNPSVAPLLERSLDVLARNLPASDAQRIQWITSTQDSTVQFLLGRHFATLVDLGGLLRHSPGCEALRAASIHLLTPDAVAQNDLFGALLKLLASFLETRVDAAPLRDLALFGADLLEPKSRRVAQLFDAFSALLKADRGRTALALIKNVLNVPLPAAGLPAGQSPAEVALSIVEDVRRAAIDPLASGGAAPPDRVLELKDLLLQVVVVIRDRQGGVAWLFDVIKSRPR